MFYFKFRENVTSFLRAKIRFEITGIIRFPHVTQILVRSEVCPRSARVQREHSLSIYTQLFIPTANLLGRSSECRYFFEKILDLK